MTTPSQFIPTDTGHGTVSGNSYVSKFDNCPKLWFHEFYYPWLSASGEVEHRGLQPKLRALSLLTGSVYHEGMAALYLSGCRDGADTGEWKVDHAIEVMESKAIDYRTQYSSDEEADNDLVQNRVYLRQYYDRFGPGSRSADWPSIQVVHDLEGKPIVEREFKIRLNDRYTYTCRSDLLIYHHGYLKTMEHKTSAPGIWLKKRLSSLSYDAQFSGEIAVMKANLPTLVGEGTPLNGVLLNVLVKGRGVKSPHDVAERETGTRTDAQLERWRLQTINTLDRIEESIQAFEKLLSQGVELEVAANQTFPTLGTRTDHCKAYNRPCDYYELCQLPGMESRLMGKYRPRTSEENTILRERPY